MTLNCWHLPNEKAVFGEQLISCLCRYYIIAIDSSMYDKLHWFIPDKRECSGFQATVSLWKGSEFHTVLLVVFVPLCCVTHRSVVTALWGMLRVLSRTLPLGFHGQSCLPHLCSWVRTCLSVRMEKLRGSGVGWPRTHPSWLTWLHFSSLCYLSPCASGITTLQSEGEGENRVSKRLLVGAAVCSIWL